ncbi:MULTISPECIES: DUF2790 domain-containing protein [unclassified Pseudomonas]|nr:MULTISPECIES: DUF2790 domain-containing protein [unclassified Pseudomonas]MEB0131973.1 DUF2790 domain-containing protein [Pseudomonas sp. CCI2.4]MEB0040942.1 DUF2790 domain-containing protein [Pseudomonas sp. MH10]MEB0089998.1 DUF2790 domain-containing protein [Pseudomonas sp. CCI4.2]MEB0102016.1 DUF2790 domain-containing protein [Pseudomonas sp. CCI3.2]MEB0120990.1 DUF2790 domain-containing protein [Pseudomonas sp. CCI1.2]
MNTSLKSTLIAFSLLALSGAASAAGNDQKSAGVEDYSYTTKLDIAKVVAGPDLNYCGIQPVEMTYRDHTGNTHTVRYEAFGSGCNNMG